MKPYTKRDYMDFLESVASKQRHRWNPNGDENLDKVIVRFVNEVGLEHGLDEGYTLLDLYGRRVMK